MRHHVLLVPGFFGFSGLGDLSYFVGVDQALVRRFGEHGLDAEVREVHAPPMASIRKRAACVREAIVEAAERGPGPVHLVGHSTGGLDARVAVSRSASLPTAAQLPPDGRVRSLITVATPHFGTPLASFFGSAMGKPLVRLLAAVASVTLAHGQVPISAGVLLGKWLTRADDWIGLDRTLLDQVYAELLTDFSPERRAQVARFVESLSSDQSLLFQLTPAGCDLLNAMSADPEGLRYGSVVTCATPPNLRSAWRNRHDVYAHWLSAVYRALYHISSRASQHEIPTLSEEQAAQLDRELGGPVSRRDNDGIVPTLCQVWGELITATRADHLDVVGHYGAPGAETPRADWFPSASAFTESEFNRVWSAVADFVVDEAKNERSRTPGAQRTDQVAGGRQKVAANGAL